MQDISRIIWHRIVLIPCASYKHTFNVMPPGDLLGLNIGLNLLIFKTL
jgi:hypothetical protein